MKKRLEKKVEKMRRKKVHEILEMVMEINTTYPRQREYTGALPTAFFEFSGHVSRVFVQIVKVRARKSPWIETIRRFISFRHFCQGS